MLAPPGGAELVQSIQVEGWGPPSIMNKPQDPELWDFPSNHRQLPALAAEPSDEKVEILQHLGGGSTTRGREQQLNMIVNILRG